MWEKSPSLREFDRAIAGLAARQHGVVSRAQLVERGLSNAAIHWRVRVGRLHRIHAGVYLVGHTARPPLALEMAAVLACGPSAVISHRSAARMWGLIDARPRQVEVTVRRSWAPDRSGIRAYATRFLTKGEVRHVQRIPVTSPARTVLDLAASTRADHYERIVAEAQAQRLVGEQELVGLLERNRGRTGAAALRRLIQGDGKPARTRSRAERKLLKLVRASPLPEPETNAHVGRHEVDLLWRDHRLAVEFDSYSFHSGRPKFERDRLRDAELQAKGFRILRVTWRQLTREPEAVVARIGAFLGERGISPT